MPKFRVTERQVIRYTWVAEADDAEAAEGTAIDGVPAHAHEKLIESEVTAEQIGDDDELDTDGGVMVAEEVTVAQLSDRDAIKTREKLADSLGLTLPEFDAQIEIIDYGTGAWRFRTENYTDPDTQHPGVGVNLSEHVSEINGFLLRRTDEELLRLARSGTDSPAVAREMGIQPHLIENINPLWIAHQAAEHAYDSGLIDERELDRLTE